eukprot:CAMPEP_0171480954 /NCGR_PEP_ID=MMETSP0946-20130122/6417_1 /TAXON_ID=109269 /ORGANISM="Vaucheria litorea, Strain CCMP2940" /LENGTH=78 /DNA_ID=CAMNT_0012012353 /DNA_START=42 /DNA_END=278 /DNA_ORIENTATION=+
MGQVDEDRMKSTSSSELTSEWWPFSFSLTLRMLRYGSLASFVTAPLNPRPPSGRFLLGIDRLFDFPSFDSRPEFSALV